MYFVFSFLEFHFHYKHLIAIFRRLLQADLQCKKQGANLWPQQLRNRSYACADGKVREKRTSSFEILKPKHIFFLLGYSRERNAARSTREKGGPEKKLKRLLLAPLLSRAKLYQCFRSTIKTLICHFGPISHAFTTASSAPPPLLLWQRCCPRTRIRSVKVENSISVYALLLGKIERRGPLTSRPSIIILE